MLHILHFGKKKKILKQYNRCNSTKLAKTEIRVPTGVAAGNVNDICNHNKCVPYICKRSCENATQNEKLERGLKTPLLFTNLHSFFLKLSYIRNSQQKRLCGAIVRGKFQQLSLWVSNSGPWAASSQLRLFYH